MKICQCIKLKTNSNLWSCNLNFSFSIAPLILHFRESKIFRILLIVMSSKRICFLLLLICYVFHLYPRNNWYIIIVHSNIKTSSSSALWPSPGVCAHLPTSRPRNSSRVGRIARRLLVLALRKQQSKDNYLKKIILTLLLRSFCVLDWNCATKRHK